jgi:guanosine-3',5'-bis(diphosphate) 3'-pyrophosphohydrolase
MHCEIESAMSPEETKARDFAIKAHSHQKYGDQPYAVHLHAVHQVLVDAEFFNAEILTASWLHDILEDTSTTRIDLETEFGPVVAKYVWAVTGTGSNRKQRNLSIYDKIHAFPNSGSLKLADRIANAEAAAQTNPTHLAMYTKEYPEFREALRDLESADARVSKLWARLDHALLKASTSTQGW